MRHNKVKPRFLDFRNILYIVVFLLLPSACTSPLETDVPIVSTKTVAPTEINPMITETIFPSEECIASFETFAYTVPEWKNSFDTGTILPLSPWRVEALIPGDPKIEGEISTGVVESRIIDGKVEIWVSRSVLNNGSYEFGEFLIYQPDSNEWKIISSEIEDTGLSSGGTYQTNDGTLWGFFNNRKSNRGAVLNKFNEATERFEFVDELPNIPIEHNRLLFDPQGIFWIIVAEDAIYSYEPATQEFRQRAEIPDLNVNSAALAPNGSLYLKIPFMSAELQEEAIFQFFPETGEIILLEIPDEPWPGPGSIFVDRDSNLWLSTVGWREPDGTWNLMHPNPEGFFENIWTNPSWATPNIFFESSNGYLWFRRTWVWNANGIAWFDPKTGEGCWFTTEWNTSIIEDPEGNLWMEVEGRLYKYVLNP